jgi:hypothetical protein
VATRLPAGLRRRHEQGRRRDRGLRRPPLRGHAQPEQRLSALQDARRGGAALRVDPRDDRGGLPRLPERGRDHACEFRGALRRNRDRGRRLQPLAPHRTGGLRPARVWPDDTWDLLVGMPPLWRLGG